jgi:hypothetical protein
VDEVPANVNAVVLNLDTDLQAEQKLHALTRGGIVLATGGTTLAGLPISGAALRQSDLSALLAEAKQHQALIVAAVADYKARAGSKTLVEPNFPADPRVEDFEPGDDSPAKRALALANYACRVWSVWLQTDAERRKRTVQPRTQVTPWIMPDELNSPLTPDFPPTFSARLIEESLV